MKVQAQQQLLEAAKAFIGLFQSSDMRPEDECHEVYGLILAAVKAVEEAERVKPKGKKKL